MYRWRVPAAFPPGLQKRSRPLQPEYAGVRKPCSSFFHRNVFNACPDCPTAGNVTSRGQHRASSIPWVNTASAMCSFRPYRRYASARTSPAPLADKGGLEAILYPVVRRAAVPWVRGEQRHRYDRIVEHVCTGHCAVPYPLATAAHPHERAHSSPVRPWPPVYRGDMMLLWKGGLSADAFSITRLWRNSCHNRSAPVFLNRNSGGIIMPIMGQIGHIPLSMQSQLTCDNRPHKKIPLFTNIREYPGNDPMPVPCAVNGTALFPRIYLQAEIPHLMPLFRRYDKPCVS